MISIWMVRANRTLTKEEAELLLRFMPEARRQRLQRVADHTRWREPLLAYGLLWLAVSRSCGDKELPEILCGERGKPVFQGRTDLHFNLSHTAGAVMVAISSEAVGVDLEKLRPVSKRVGERLKAAGETVGEYFQNWVRYEAVVKRSGEGVLPHDGRECIGEAQLIETFPEYCAAVCGKGTASVVYVETMGQLLEDLASE